MGKIVKGSNKWKVFSEVFVLYSESGEPSNNEDWDVLVKSAEKICEKYQNTEAKDLAVKLCLAICDTAEEEYKARKESEINYG